MIDVKKLQLGDTVFRVNERNNAFSKQKLKMIDEHGNEWFRYDQPHWEYSIEEIVYCGRVEFQRFGETNPSEYYANEFHFKHPDGQIYAENEESFAYEERWFHTREEADQEIEELKILRSG